MKYPIRTLSILAIAGVLWGCPGQRGNPISFEVENRVSRDVEIIEVEVFNEVTSELESFNLTSDPINFGEVRGFCCYSPGEYTVFIRTADGRSARLPNIDSGEEMRTIGIRLLTTVNGVLFINEF